MSSENVAFQYKRLLSLPRKQHFFLFGPRNTGKSTLIRELFPSSQALYIDLLDPVVEKRLSLNPEKFIDDVDTLPDHITHVIVDEIQKIPKLLDVVHLLISRKKKYFIMTGSSARKLKAGGANLLAGRAFVYNLHGFSYFEVKSKFSLKLGLEVGMLPEVFSCDLRDDIVHFLKAYTNTYLKEEVWAEQLIKSLTPFRRFLEVAAQSNGCKINLNKIAKDIGGDWNTIQNYYSILEDTLIGFFLDSFQHSFRKRLASKPKFYFFDTGVVRALNLSVSLPLRPGTSAYGDAFEHFIILECHKLVSYFHPEYRLSYLETKDGAEIDLVVERPGKPVLFIEIKSTDNVREDQLKTFSNLVYDFGACEAVCLSNDPQHSKYGKIKLMPWQDGLEYYFLPEKISE